MTYEVSWTYHYVVKLQCGLDSSPLGVCTAEDQKSRLVDLEIVYYFHIISSGLLLSIPSPGGYCLYQLACPFCNFDHLLLILV